MYFVGDLHMYKRKGKKKGNDDVSMKAHNTIRILPKIRTKTSLFLYDCYLKQRTNECLISIYKFKLKNKVTFRIAKI